MQVRPATSSAFLRGQALVARPVAAARLRCSAPTCAAAQQQEDRLRLNNLSPQDGSRRKNLRKGRGHAAGQGASCGFGMRGQKSRSGSGVRPGFEGGQMPLYRRLPKLKGIAGGMGAGVPDFVVINLDDLAKFSEGEEVTLATLQQKRVLNVSGREAKLPLKVLGNGELPLPLTIHAAAFSEAAKAKIEAAGGKVVEVAQKPKWTRKAHEASLAAAGTPWTKSKFKPKAK